MKTRKVVRMPLRRPPPPPRPSGAKLRAKAATAEEAYEDEDYEAYDEPNMKLSHAVFVVLILHVIVVGAIFAFNSIKARQITEQKNTSPAPAVAETTAAPSTVEPEVQTTKPPVAAASAEKTYTVQPGDTLTRIAALTDVSLAALQHENGLDSYSMLRVGQVLKLPAPGAKVAAAPAPAPKVAAAGSAKPAAAAAAPPDKPAAKEPAPAKTAAPEGVTGDVYVVAKGDNPYSIAKKLHIGYNELLALNDIKDPTKIQIGQKLKIPAKKD